MKSVREERKQLRNQLLNIMIGQHNEMSYKVGAKKGHHHDIKQIVFN